MPLYEYQCDACAHRFEEIQRLSDPAVETCPSCGGSVRKLPSMPAIQFKGSGWYITDYARKGQQPEEGSGPKGTESTDKSPSSDKATPAPAADSSKTPSSSAAPAAASSASDS